MKRNVKKVVGGIERGISKVKERRSLWYDFDLNVVWVIRVCIC